MLPVTGRPRSVTVAAVGLAIGALASIELTRRVMFALLEILGPPPLDQRPLALAIFLAGILLWFVMLAVATVAGFGIISAGRLLRGYGSSRYEGIALAAMGCGLAVVAAWLGVFGEQRALLLLSLLSGNAGIVLAIERGAAWFEPMPRRLPPWLGRPVPIEVEVDDE